MLEVLKKLYGEAVTEESLAKFKEELGKRFIPKSDFNQRGEELKLLRDKVAQQETTLAEFETVTGKLEALKLALEKAEEEKAELIATYESKQAAERMKNALDEGLKKAGARNLTAVKALLDMESITLEEGTLIGFDEQLWQLKQENSYLFEAGENNIQFMRPAAKGKTEVTVEDFKNMGYMERLKMKKEQPEMYQALVQNNRR